jgi:hypothetical protein
MELTSELLNDDRDEDRDGPVGFESKAERARLFAAEMALQFFALMAAAKSAIAAYADITGENWKPYESPTPPAAGAARKSAAVEKAPSRRRDRPRRGRSRSRLRLHPEAAVVVYKHSVGETRKTCVADDGVAQSLTRGAAAGQMVAFA